jgi:hypothetical protein
MTPSKIIGIALALGLVVLVVCVLLLLGVNPTDPQTWGNLP